MIGWFGFGIVAASAQTSEEPQALPESVAESTHDRFVSMRDVAPNAALVRPVTAPIVLQQGPERLTLTGGWLVPVFSGRQSGAWERDVDAWVRKADPEQVPRVPSPEERGTQELVGFVWTGGVGALSLSLPDRADAMILANRAVRELGGDPARYAALARDRVLDVPVTEAIVLSVDPALDAAFTGPDGVDPYEIVVVGSSDEARRRARQAVAAFERRAEVWDEIDRDVADRIAWERLAEQRGLLPEGGRYVHWDLLTGDRFGLVAPAVGGELDQWLAVTTDPTGATDARREIRVAALGLAPDGRDVDGLVGGVPFPPSVPGDPTSAPLARRRVEPVGADATVLVAPDPANLTLKVTVDATLRMQAAGGSIGWIDLELPRVDAVPGSFRVVKAELLDGTPLLGRDAERVTLTAADDGEDDAPPPPPPPAPRPRDRRAGPQPEPEPAPLPEPDALDELGGRVRLQLPAPLAPGEIVDVHLVYEDTWLFAHGTEVANVGSVSLGVTSGLHWFLPTVAPIPLGAPWPFRARLGVPEGIGFDAVLSGKTRRQWVENGWAFVEADSEGHPGYWASAVVGQYVDREAPEQLGLPAVRVHLASTHFGTIDQFAPEVRRIVKFYEGWLPPFPVREVEVFESPRGVLGMRWVAPHGTVDVQQMLTLMGASNPRNRQPHLEQAILAHELAHQYFGHLAPPASVEDFWISESFSELFACVYVSGAFDRRHCEVRMDAKRARWERADAPPVEASLSRAYLLGARGPTVYDYGPYLLGEVLSRRIGVEPFFGAVDLMLRDHAYEPLTTERLQAYLEAAAGRDLDDAFDFWVHGGYVPALDLTWRQEADGRIVGAVTADVPFGTFDVPVRVSTKEGAVDVMVTVVDGEGELDVAAPAGKPKLALDPDGWVIARSRRVRRE